jgi:hypothetical protein
VFSLFRGLWAAECVQISFMGPCGGPFLLVVSGLAAPSLGLDSSVAAYSFMAGGAWSCMTCCDLGIKNSMVIPVGSQNSWEIFVVSSAMFSSSGQEPGQPIAFGDDKGHRRLEQPPRLSLGPGRFFFLSVSHCRNRSGPLGTPSQKAHCVALSGPVRWWRSGRSPMICAGRGATVAIVQPERDSFAGGACANPSFQYLYLISRSASAGGRCRGGGSSNGRFANLEPAHRCHFPKSSARNVTSPLHYRNSSSGAGRVEQGSSGPAAKCFGCMPQ